MTSLFYNVYLWPNGVLFTGTPGPERKRGPVEWKLLYRIRITSCIVPFPEGYPLTGKYMT